MAKKRLFKISYKITALVILMVVTCSVSIGAFVYRFVESDLFEAKGMMAQMMASSLASALDWQSIQTIIENEEKDEYYEFLRNTIIQTGVRMPGISYSYVMSMREPYFFIIYAQDAQGSYIEELGFLYELVYWNEAAIHASTAGEPAFSKPYSVPGYGEFVSGYAPISDEAGNAIAIVGFDLPLDDIIDELTLLRNSIVTIISFFIFCSVILTILFTKRYITIPLTSLRAASNKIATGDMNIYVPDKETNDEIGLLAKDFVRVRNVLNNLNNEINRLVISAAKGDLLKKIEIHRYEGAWGELAKELNNLLDVMSGHNVQLLDALDKAEAANKAKTNFLATMSHEIRTPMNAILGITQILLQNEELPKQYALEVEKIYASGTNLLGIINDILDLSKIETGKMELNLCEYDVPSLINDAASLNIVRIGSKPIELILDIDENLPSRLIGDELRLKQILNNLLSNAIKYTESGYVKLSVSHSMEDGDVSLHFIIEDTGQGMKLEDRDSFFSEYSRFNVGANRATEGTGLGLSITKTLVEMMGGTIWAESEYGKGSIFMVMVKQGMTDCSIIGAELAAQLSSFEFRGNPHFEILQVDREPMPYGKVLIVDDVETNLYVAKGLMMPYQLDIETAISGFLAIDLVSGGNTYDIIFMDHMMPKMDGIETVIRLRAAGYLSPIVALTANAVVGQAEVFFENGFDDFISKPIDIRQLNSILNKFIRDKQPPEVIAAARKTAKEMPQHELKADAELLAIFAKDAKRAMPVIEAITHDIETAADDDIRMFVVSVHAMKSALANIGEHGASKLADTLERAGKEQNKTVMQAKAKIFIDMLQSIVSKIDVQSDDSNLSYDSNPEMLHEKLKLIIDACDEYDDQAVEAVLAELKEKQWSRETRELLDKVAELILHSEFEAAAELVTSSF